MSTIYIKSREIEELSVFHTCHTFCVSYGQALLRSCFLNSEAEFSKSRKSTCALYVALFCFASIRAVALQLVLFSGDCILSPYNKIIRAVNSFYKFIKIKQS
jgi:hypothetical protein